MNEDHIKRMLVRHPCGAVHGVEIGVDFYAWTDRLPTDQQNLPLNEYLYHLYDWDHDRQLILTPYTIIRE